jgi:hypothetical protein
MRTDSIPIDTVSRGRLRLWKRAARQRYERVAQACQTDAFCVLIRDFYSKRGRGQQRALAKLKNTLKEARFVQCRLESPAYALRAILKPRGSIICDVPGVDAGRLQDCVVVAGLPAGRLSLPDGTPHFGIAGPGIWTIEVQDHALGRLLQRDPGADIDAVLWGAHQTALNMHIDKPVDTNFWLPTGNGGFVAQMVGTRTQQNDGEFGFHVQCRTWLHNDQLDKAKIPVATTNTFGERMGDNFLLPVPLRHLAQVPECSAAKLFFTRARELIASTQATHPPTNGPQI